MEEFKIGNIAEVVANHSSGYPEGTTVKIVEHGLWEPWYLTTEILDMDFSHLDKEEILNHPRVRSHSARELKLVK